MSIKNAPTDHIVRACQLFVESRLSQISIVKVAEQLSAETRTTYTRVDVNRMLAKAFKEGIFVVRPPPHRTLEEELCERYAAAEGSVHVVPAALGGASEAVASAAAHDSVRLIRELAGKKTRKGPVGVGLVGGRTMQRVSQLMAEEWRADPGLPEVTLHAACSGFDPDHPETAPVTFLGYFDGIESVKGCTALFSPPAVEARKYADEIKEGIVSRFFERAKEIDLVITSLAAYRDRHNILRELARTTKSPHHSDDSIIGDIGYSFFDSQGPFEVKRGYRAVTLFSIKDLVGRARDRSKEVMLVAGPCPSCEGDERLREKSVRDDAIHPLMTVPELRAWSHLYLDSTTASRLLAREKRMAG